MTWGHSDEEIVAVECAAFKFVESVNEFELEVCEFPVRVYKFDEAFKILRAIA